MKESLAVDTTLAHYHILSLLGAGGMGEVYLAEDTRLGRKVALKLLPARLTQDTERLHRFVQEAKATSALNHPHIVTIYEIGEDEAGRFIAMELVEGQTLRALPKPCPFNLLINLAVQIARALAATHAAGITHRDVKPENIMLRHDGYVKVLDFGLARLAPLMGSGSEAATLIHNTAPGALLGTLAYLSPEQARGEVATSAADIFALGIVLYELSTGQHPFKADSLLGILHSITSQTPLPASRLNPEIPASLDALILSMLEKDAGIRPTAEGLEKAFGELLGSSGDVHLQRAIKSTPERHTVGRESELAELRAGYESVLAGPGLLLCVTGEPGIGKTTLVEAFLDEIAAEGRSTIARGRCSERLAGTEAYLPMLEALESLVQSGSNPAIARVLRQIAPTWYAQIVPLSSTDEESARLLNEVKAASQERMKRELGAFLQEVARQRPLVLSFDDIHWADISTIDLLNFLAGKFDGLDVLIVVTYRPSDLLLTKHPFLQIKLDLQARGVCREIALEFLNQKEVQKYLALEFPGNSFPAEFSKLIHEKTEGSPLFMADLVRYLVDRGVITAGEDGRDARSRAWTLTRKLSEIVIELPESVRGMIERKIAQLSEDDRRLLTAASVQGYQFDSAVLAKALELDAADVEERLETLDRVNGLVRFITEREFPGRVLTLRCQFVHVLYQNALYASLRPTRKTQLSAKVAEALLGLSGKQGATIASELAFLFEAARDWSRASAYYLIAADNASEVFAHLEAGTLAYRGLETLRPLPDTTERAKQELKLQVMLGQSLMVSKGYASPEVEQAFVRARDLSLQLDDRAQLFRAQFSLAIVYIVRAEYRRALEHAGQCLNQAADTQNPAMLMQSHWVHGLGHCYLGEFEAARFHFEQTIAIHDAAGIVSSVSLYGAVLSRAHLARMLLYLGYADQSESVMKAAMAKSERLFHPIGQANTLALAAFLEAFHHRPQQTAEIADLISRCSEEHGLPYYSATGMVMRGWAMSIQGQAEEGLALIREGLASHLATGTRQQHTYFLALLAEALSKAGDVSAALEVLTQGISVAKENNEPYYEAELYRLKGEALLRGSPEEGEACLRQAIETAQHQQAKSMELRAAISLARLWQVQGKIAEARHMLAEIYGWFTEGFDTPDLRDAAALLEQLK